MVDIEPLAKGGLFAHCSFAIIRSAGFKTQDAELLANELRLHDGEAVIDQYPEHSLDLRGITHVIANTYDFPDYNACQDALIPVVKRCWVQHSLAKDKLLNPRQYNPDPRYFMSDVVACTADLPEGDSDAIAGGILAMGGLFSNKLTSQVTHIIALVEDSDICTVAQKKRLNVKIVLPHWVDDCLKLGRKIDEHPYLLPDPEILRPSNNKVPVSKRQTVVHGAVDPNPSQNDREPITSRKLERVFRTKTVMLASDLGISRYLRGVLDGLITNGGGKLTDTVGVADMYICRYRDAADYRTASRAGKDVGNLAWLYFLIQTDEWTSPLRRLLHYPIARNGLPGFASLKISLSNYSGEARTYLENLITATGAESTKSLKQDNTHLITAHVLSEKCAAAKDWGIHIVNHLWLEESYAKWKMQSVTDGRYTHFPKRTNLSDVVGHTQLDRQILERCFFPAETTGANMTGPMRHVDQNSITGTRPTVSAEASNRGTSSDDLPVDPAEKVRTPAASKFAAPGKENITPSTVSGRKSKEVASARLHSMTPDILLYQKERKRVGGVVYGGRRKSDEDRVKVSPKRPLEETLGHDVTDENEPKRIKGANPAPVMHLVVSGYHKWVDHTKVEDNDKKQLRKLGIICTTEPSRATHLAAPHMVRTQKFVTALAYAPMVVSTDFIDACLRENDLLDPATFKLVDTTSEKKLGVSLKTVRERAKNNNQRLLQGRNIYCMANIRGGFETFQTIVEANGGRCMLWRGRKGTVVRSVRADSDVSTATAANKDVYLLSDERQENKGLWYRFREMAEESRNVPRIVGVDWLLDTAMSQKLLPTKLYEL